MRQTLDQLIARPLRTEVQAKCDILPPRHKGWHSFEVREVYYGVHGTASFHLDVAGFVHENPALYGVALPPDAYGVYGIDPSEGLQYFISDCKTLADAEILRQTLAVRCDIDDMSIGDWRIESTVGAKPDLYQMWSDAVKRNAMTAHKFYKVPDA